MASKSQELSQDVPIFLRKTYHMIDTCDPDIACWSDDGETFVVKDPVKFERTIIPQFFKHSKFSSFVRQLNFYSFRKIKYADTIRIDPKLEAETANYWRFRHESFRRGRPDLLTEIKRMNGQKNSGSATSTKQPEIKIEPDKSSNSEVQALKKRLEEMSKNIDQLTAMVQKVSLKQEEQEKVAAFESIIPVGSKRVKLDPIEDIVRPDEMLSNMDFDEEIVMPVMSMPPPAVLAKRETTADSTQISDNEFVDELFTAFNDEDDMFPIESVAEDATLVSESNPNSQLSEEISNRPDPELMNRLSNALALLPKDIQVLIIDRLIAAILSTDALEHSALITAALQDLDFKKSTPVEMPKTPGHEEKTQPQFNLAAATLAAMLHHYNSQMKTKNPKSVQKSIPVIPVHA